MTLIEIPNLSFDKWQKWADRPRPSLDLDTPLRFGVLGLYILAESTENLGHGPIPLSGDLPEGTLYIGMSTNVHRRLEATHRAVQRYRNQENAGTSNLWFTTWQSEWSNSKAKQSCGIIGKATLALYERALILSYARTYGRLPKLNRE